MQDAIAELLNTPIPEKLWHYSSFAGFQGIVTSKSIFATDLRFLNDSREFIYTQQLAKEVAAAVPEYGELGFPRREYAIKGVDVAFATEFLDLHNGIQIFVACFSNEEDQLGQWRGYSRGSSGVSLAFNLAELRPPRNLGTFVTFAPCVYEASDQRRLVACALNHFTESCEENWNRIVKALEKTATGEQSQHPAVAEESARRTSKSLEFASALQTGTNRTRMELLKIAALLKDPAFHEEREWRLVLPILADRIDLQNPRCFRPGDTTLIPYIKYPLSRGSEQKLPLVDLILGPGSDSNAAEAARTFLRSEHLDVIPRNSRVPYRPSW